MLAMLAQPGCVRHAEHSYGVLQISLAQKIAVAGSPEKGYDFMFDRV